MRTAIVCALLSCACALPPRPPRSDSEEREVQAVRASFTALAAAADRELSVHARNKKEFLAVLELLEEQARAAGGAEGYLRVAGELRAAALLQPEDAPPDPRAFLPALRELLALARAGGAQDADIQQFLSSLASLAQEVKAAAGGL